MHAWLQKSELDMSHHGQTKICICAQISGAAAQACVARAAMRNIVRALSNAIRAQRHPAGLQQRTQASLAARDATQPELPPFDHEPVQYTGPSKQNVIELRKRYLNPGEAAHVKAFQLLAREALKRAPGVQQFLLGTKTQS